MKEKTILNGLFHVFEDGRIYKLLNGIEEPAKIYWVGQRKKYGTISYSLNGIQKWEYVHRIIAMTFIPNPNRYPQVNHIDGNTKNNSASNLEWVTPKMNIQHAYKTGLINPYSQKKVCSVCGKRIGNNSSVPFCKECFAKNLKVKRQHKKRMNREHFQFLYGRDKQIMDMWCDGDTYQKIGETFGISKQRVYQIVRKSLNFP